jgi:hypothetical protein
MCKRLVAFTIAISAMSMGSAYTQRCLHDQGETPEQTARRREALVAARFINTIQINQPGAIHGVFLRHMDLAGSPSADTRNSTNETLRRISLNPDEDILPGWKLTLDVSENAYWFMIKDKMDPCGFAYISNHAGVIFLAEPIR